MFNVQNHWWGNCYFAYDILPSGQTVKIEFEEDSTGDKYYYNVHFVTMDKRKNSGETTLHVTGKDGLLGLLWAKQKIIEFEQFIISKAKCRRAVILCQWDDNRRRNAYYRGLKGIGYDFGFVFGRKALLKQIEIPIAGKE